MLLTDQLIFKRTWYSMSTCWKDFSCLHPSCLATYPGDLGEQIIKLPWIITAHVSLCHQLQGDCVSSWLVLTLAGLSLCYLSPVPCPPSCYATSAHSKQLRGTNSEKPEHWVTNSRETSELTAMNAQRGPFSWVIKHSCGHLCDSVLIHLHSVCLAHLDTTPYNGGNKTGC